MAEPRLKMLLPAELSQDGPSDRREFQPEASHVASIAIHPRTVGLGSIRSNDAVERGTASAEPSPLSSGRIMVQQLQEALRREHHDDAAFHPVTAKAMAQAFDEGRSRAPESSSAMDEVAKHQHIMSAMQSLLNTALAGNRAAYVPPAIVRAMIGEAMLHVQQFHQNWKSNPALAIAELHASIGGNSLLAKKHKRNIDLHHMECEAPTHDPKHKVHGPHTQQLLDEALTPNDLGHLLH